MLKIVVLVKQVPNAAQVRTDPVTHNLVREGVPSIVNPFDLFAVEEALRLKERYGAEITAISMGPPHADEVLYYALAMGADKGILLTDRAFAGADTLATSYTLAQAVKAVKGADLILTGKQAMDGDTAQVPVEIAENLGIGCLTYVTEIAEIGNGRAEVFRQIEAGKARSEVKLPAVLTLEKGLNEPRLPRVSDMVRASEMTVETWGADAIGADPARLSSQGSPTRVVRIFSPEKKKAGVTFDGSPDEMAEAFAAELKTREIVRRP